MIGTNISGEFSLKFYVRTYKRERQQRKSVCCFSFYASRPERRRFILLSALLRYIPRTGTTRRTSIAYAESLLFTSILKFRRKTCAGDESLIFITCASLLSTVLVNNKLSAEYSIDKYKYISFRVR